MRMWIFREAISYPTPRAGQVLCSHHRSRRQSLSGNERKSQSLRKRAGYGSHRLLGEMALNVLMRASTDIIIG